MTEPVAISGALGAVLSTGVALVAVFTPGITQEMQIAIIAFGNSVIALGVILFARARVTPLSDPMLREGTSVSVTNPAGEVVAVQRV